MLENNNIIKKNSVPPKRETRALMKWSFLNIFIKKSKDFKNTIRIINKIIKINHPIISPKKSKTFFICLFLDVRILLYYITFLKFWQIKKGHSICDPFVLIKKHNV